MSYLRHLSLKIIIEIVKKIVKIILINWVFSTRKITLKYYFWVWLVGRVISGRGLEWDFLEWLVNTWTLGRRIYLRHGSMKMTKQLFYQVSTTIITILVFTFKYRAKHEYRPKIQVKWAQKRWFECIFKK